MARKIIWLCLLPLCLGAFVYLFFREQGLWGITFRSKKINHSLIVWLINVLPDFLWAFSFSCALYLYSGFINLPFKRVSLLIALLMISAEAVQILFPRYFTFDYSDLVAAVLGFILSYRYFKDGRYENEVH